MRVQFVSDLYAVDLNSGQPFQARWCQMVTLHSVQGHTGLTDPF